MTERKGEPRGDQKAKKEESSESSAPNNGPKTEEKENGSDHNQEKADEQKGDGGAPPKSTEDETNPATRNPVTDRNRDKAAKRETLQRDERTRNHSSRKDKRARNQLQTDTGWRPTDRKARRTREKARNIWRAWKTPQETDTRSKPRWERRRMHPRGPLRQDH